MMAISEKNAVPQSRKIMQWLLTLVLWLATGVVGALAFVAIQNIATTAMAFALTGSPNIGVVGSRGWITTTRNLSAIVGGILWLGVVVGGLEYHFHHIGKQRSWRLFAWTLGIEIALIVLNAVFVALFDLVF